MAIANELSINTAATALDMANAIFGSGVTVQSATFQGDALSSGTYSGALSTIAGISPTNAGVILSTGRVTDFTNSSGTTNTNVAAGTGTNVVGGIDGDAQLNALAGVNTFDAAILNVTFIPDGDYLTIQFVFSSEEYPEYVNGGINDAFGVWVNGVFVPVSVTAAGDVSIDSVNQGSNENLYIDNTSDQYNTEMDGFTRVLSFKAPVNSGQVNTIKIAVADGADAIYDSNLLIMGDSGQTFTLAIDDDINVVANSSRTFDILANDVSRSGAALTITQINGVNVVAGQTVTLISGQQVTLNANGTVTVTANGTLGSENLTYTVSDGTNTDVGYITVNTSAAPVRDGIVSGTTGNDWIDASYLGDADGDRIDNNDNAVGTNDDLVYGYGGNDTIFAGAGNDTVYGGDGNDVLYSGAGNDSLTGGAGNDSLIGGDGNDTINGGNGRDVLTGGLDADQLSGGADADTIYGGAGDVIDGGETTTAGGTDNDVLVVEAGSVITYGGGTNEAGTIALASGGTLTFSNIENLVFAGPVDGTSGADAMSAGYTDLNGDQVDGTDGVNDTIYGYAGNDTISAGSGNDTVFGGVGDDSVLGGSGRDSILGEDGNDTILGGAESDTLDGGAGNDSISGDNGTIGEDGQDLIYGGAGNDTIDGGWNSDTIYGGDGSDLITDGVSGLELIYAGVGDDTVYGGGDSDTVYGADGRDVLYGGAGGDSLWGENDADTFYGGADDFVTGGEGTSAGGTDNDVLVVEAGSIVTYDGVERGTVALASGGTLTFREIENIVFAGPVDGTAGNDTMGAGYTDLNGDQIDGTDGLNDTIFANDGNDSVIAGFGDDIVYGGLGNDTLNGQDGNDSLIGGAGDDSAQGGAGDDLADLGDGNDRFGAGITETGNDTVYGGLGNDTMSGGIGEDVLDGGVGDDSLSGGSDNDTLYGGAGIDTFFVASVDGVDTISGGSENDLLYLSNPTGGATVVFSSTATGTYSFTDTAANGSFNTLEGVVVTDQNDLVDATNDAGGVYVSGYAGNDTIIGGSAGDSLSGGDGNDTITGGAGNDTMSGNSGDDTLVGDVGADWLYSGAGDDLAYGGADNDSIDASTGNDVVYAGTGEDLVYGGAGNDTIYGDAGNDNLQGWEGSDVIYGGAGNDSINGLQDADTLYGGAGDTVIGGETVTTGTDNDVLVLNYADVQQVTYGGGNNEAGTVTFTAASGGGTLTFSEIENIVYAGPVDGTAGDDIMNVGYTDLNGDIIDGADGLNDTIFGYAGNDEIHGGDGNDLINGGTGNDSLFGDLGNDTIVSGTGDDTVSGGDGNDSIANSAGYDVAYGGAGNDTIVGSGMVFGDDGNDIIDFSTSTPLASPNQADGGAGDDTVIGGNATDDVLYLSAGNDSFTGGGNTGYLDWVSARDLTQGAVINLATGQATFATNTTTFTGVEAAQGSDFADAIIGDSNNNQLIGGAGNDLIVTGNGADSVWGDDGADTVFGGSGDVITGGEGGTDNDALVLNYADVQSITYGGGNNEAGTVTFTTASGGGTLTFSEIENIVYAGPVDGTAGDDLMEVGYTDLNGDQVDDQDDTILGYAGNDYIAGGNGNDTIFGGTNDDTVIGAIGDDVLYGDEGSDVLYGGAGNDIAFGGEGNDRIETGADADTIYGGSNDAVHGGEDGDDNDTLIVTDVDYVLYAGGDGEAGTVYFNDGNTMTFSGIEHVSADGVVTDASDGIVAGTAGDDAINGGYAGDPDGDMVDADDAVLAGTSGNDDVIVGAGGNDVINAGDGNDAIFGDERLVGDVAADTQFTLDWNTVNLDGQTDFTVGGSTVSLVVNTPVSSAGNEAYLSSSDGTATLGSYSDTAPTVVSMTFSEPVMNVTFDLLDVDADIDYDDKITIIALDANGNQVHVEFSSLYHHNVNGNTVDASGAYGSSIDGFGAPDSITVTISAPIVSLQVVHEHGDTYASTGTIMVGPLTFSTTTDVMALTDGNDYIDAGEGDDLVYGGGGNDDLFAGVGADTVYGGTGVDQVYGGDGNDSLDGGADNDYMQGDAGNDTVVGGIGDDFIRGDAGNDFVYGGVGNDSVYGGAGNDQVFGGDGNDQIFGGFGDDTVYAGAGNDTVTGSGENDIVYGEDGDDYMQGSNGADTLYGGAGNDTILGEEDGDTIYAGAGDYVDGSETVTTGTDNDTLNVSGPATVVWDTGNPENGTINFTAGGSLSFYNIEHLFIDGVEVFSPNYVVDGTAGDDLINGTYVDAQGDMVDAADNVAGNDDDVIVAGAGNDTIYSAAANDLIYAGDGNDDVNAGFGDDTAYGGEGNDSLHGMDGEDAIYGGTGDDSLFGWGDNDTVDGGVGNDLVDGETGNDLLSGDLGNDTLIGDAGEDTLLGGTGDDQLYGGLDADILDAGDGNDAVFGAEGNDTLIGGEGSDLLLGQADRDVIFGGAGDTVDGGEAGDDYDVLDLTAFGHPATNVIYDTLNPENGTVEFLDGTGAVVGTLSFSNIEQVIACFTPGAMILTIAGEVPVEDLRVGDLVLTRDNGYQQICWVGRRDLSLADLLAAPQFNPVKIAAGALGSGLPVRDMLVSPQHRMLIANPRAELLFGDHEVLISAKHLAGLPAVEQVAREGVSYIHFMCKNHEIVRADGAWTESFQPGALSLAGLEDDQRAEILTLFPELSQGDVYPAARMTLQRSEAAVLLGG